MTPLVSIVIPTFNRAHLISETLDSIIAQTHTNWECIVVDDGSTDETINVLKAYVEKDKRFQLHKRPTHKLKGANACRNFGFKKSKGEYLIFLDSDDLLENTCLETRVKIFGMNINSDFLVFKMGEFKKAQFSDNKLIVESNVYSDIKGFLNQNYPWNITGPIWKRNFLDDNLNFDERLTRFQDIDFHIRVLLKNNLEYKIISITDCYYRKDCESQKRFLKTTFKNEIIKSYYVLLSNIFEKASGLVLSKVVKEIKFGFFKVITKFADNKNKYVVKDIYDLLSKNLKLSFKEKFYYGLLILLSVYYKNNKGYYTLRKPISNYFQNLLQSK